MAVFALPNDLDAFAHITDPDRRTAIEQKLQRYIARGLWAQQALALLHHEPRPLENASTARLCGSEK